MEDKNEKYFPLVLLIVIIIGILLCVGSGVGTYKLVWAIAKARNHTTVTCPVLAPPDNCPLPLCKEVRPCPARPAQECPSPPTKKDNCRSCPSKRTCSNDNCKKCLPARSNQPLLATKTKNISGPGVIESMVNRTLFETLKNTPVNSIDRFNTITSLLKFGFDPNMEIINRKLCDSNKTTNLNSTKNGVYDSPFDNYRTVISDGEYLLKVREKSKIEEFVEEENHHDLCTVCQDKYDYINCVMKMALDASTTNNNQRTLPQNYNFKKESSDLYTRDAFKFGVLRRAFDQSTIQFDTGYIGNNFFNTIDALTLNTSKGVCRLCSYETSFKDKEANNAPLTLEKYIKYFFIGNNDNPSFKNTGVGGGCLRTGHLDKTVYKKKFYLS
jgi:hypothetical protein